MKNDYFNTFEEKDLKISEDIELDIEEPGLYVQLEGWFDVDKKFGINTLNDDQVWVNVFSVYNPITNELRMFYDIDTPDNAMEREYLYTPEEKKLLIGMIEQTCIKQNDKNCREFYIREYIEMCDYDINLVCEEKNGGVQIKNAVDDVVLYYSEDESDRRYIGKNIELANYGSGECYSIECTDNCEVIYSTDSEELDEQEEQMPEQTM